MRLWLLLPREDLSEEQESLFPKYDKTVGLVVRATDENQARFVASEGEDDGDMRAFWLGKQYSTCSDVPIDGEPEIVLASFYHG